VGNDGELEGDANQDSGTPSAGSNTFIGRNPYFNGTIDDVIVFNKSMSATQIMALYENRTDLIVSNETAKGQAWQACITVNDGSADGDTECSNNLTIANSVPLHSTPTVNSTSGNNYLYQRTNISIFQE